MRDHRRTRLLVRSVVAALLLLGSLGLAAADSARAVGRSLSISPLSIKIVGNHFVNQDGQTVRLLGVDRPSSEYACYYGYAYTNQDGSYDSDAAAIAAWHPTAVRVPLNEDCWLGINGSPSGTGQSAAGYQQAIEDYVAALHAQGLYVILDLHWSAPGTTPADGQRELGDDHSVAFWTSVAGAFAGDPAVVFDAFNEPIGEPGFPLSWTCWRDGGCTASDSADGSVQADDKDTYTTVGMQAMVNAIRAGGATQPIMLGGLAYANDLSQWLAFEPHDPLTDSGGTAQLAASFHNYQGEDCGTAACWDSQIAPVAAEVPVVTGEYGEDDCATNGDDPGIFDNQWMSWADAHGVSYIAWAWIVSDGTVPCSSFDVITDYAGTPRQPNGVSLHDHLAALAAGGSAPPTTAPAGPTTTPSPAATASPSPTPTPTATKKPLTALNLKLHTATLKGRRFALTTTQAASYSGHLSVTIVIREGRRKHTLRASFLARRGYAVTLPRGATVVSFVVSRTSGSGFTSGSVRKQAKVIRVLR